MYRFHGEGWKKTTLVWFSRKRLTNFRFHLKVWQNFVFTPSVKTIHESFYLFVGRHKIVHNTFAILSLGFDEVPKNFDWAELLRQPIRDPPLFTTTTTFFCETFFEKVKFWKFLIFILAKKCVFWNKKCPPKLFRMPPQNQEKVFPGIWDAVPTVIFLIRTVEILGRPSGDGRPLAKKPCTTYVLMYSLRYLF